MSIVNNSWFWLLISGFIFLILFVMIYIQEKFTNLAILVLSMGIAIFILAGITGLTLRVGAETKRLGKLVGQEIQTDTNLQRKFIGVTLGAVKSVGDATIHFGKVTGETIKPSAIAKSFLKEAKGGFTY